MVDNIAGGLRGSWDAMTNALQLRNQTVSTNVLNRTQQANTEIQSSEDIIIGYARTADDDTTNDTHAAVGNFLTTQKQFITDTVNNSLPFEQTLIGSLGNILTNVRSLSNSATLSDALSIKNIFQQATTTDDGIFPNWADLQTKQAMASTVTQRDYATNASLPSYAFTPPGRTYANYLMTMHQDDASYSATRQTLVAQFLANPAVPPVGQVQQQQFQQQQFQQQQFQQQQFQQQQFQQQQFQQQQGQQQQGQQQQQHQQQQAVPRGLVSADARPGTGGFFDSIGSSIKSMGQSYYAIGQYVVGNSDGAARTLAQAYANGPIGQAEKIGPGTYNTTVGSLYVASFAIGAAVSANAISYNPVLWGGAGSTSVGVATTTSVTTAVGEAVVTTIGNVARITIHNVLSFTPQTIRQVFIAARAQGATSAIINTGHVVKADLAIKLGLAAQRGTLILGGTVRLVEGGPFPIFEIVIPILK